MKWRHLLNVITTKRVILISQIDVASAVFDRKFVVRPSHRDISGRSQLSTFSQ